MTPHLGSASVEKSGTGMLNEQPGQESMSVTVIGCAPGLQLGCAAPHPPHLSAGHTGLYIP